MCLHVSTSNAKNTIYLFGYAEMLEPVRTPEWKATIIVMRENVVAFSFGSRVRAQH